MFFKNEKKVTKVEKLNLSIKINDEFLKIIMKALGHHEETRFFFFVSLAFNG